MASRFELHAWRDVPAFLLSALRIRRQMLRSPGVVGVSLEAQPAAKRFYTLSAWASRDAMDRAVVSEPHAATMARFHPRMKDSLFTFWTVVAPDRPEWADAHRRLLEAERGNTASRRPPV